MTKPEALCQLMNEAMKDDNAQPFIEPLVCYMYYDGDLFSLNYVEDVGHFFSFAGEGQAEHYFFVEVDEIKALYAEQIVLQDLFKQSFDKHGGYIRFAWDVPGCSVSVVTEWNDYPSGKMNVEEPRAYFEEIKCPHDVYKNLDMETFLPKVEATS